MTIHRMQPLLAVCLLFATFESAHACRIIAPRPIIAPQPRPAPVRIRPIETRRHAAEITIDGQAVTVAVKATFHNPNAQRLEGTYFFPLPADVAVQGFSMWMNGKEVKGELLDADRARSVYEEIVRRIKDPGLLEFVGMQMIKVRVFPIEPRSDVQIRLTYHHLVTKDAGMYALRYPLSSARPDDAARVVVGNEVRTEPSRGPAATIGEVAIRVTLKSRIALKNIFSPTHRIDQTRPDDFTAVVGYEGKQIRPERDFELYWDEAEEEIGASVLTHQGAERDGYFMLLLSPRVEVPEDRVARKEVVFVLDKSGSMQDNDKIEQAKGALRYCLQKLRPADRFNVVTFSTATRSFETGLVEATPDNVRRALAYVEGIDAAGGTAIDQALNTGFQHLRGAESLPMMLFLTDGLPTVGETNIEAIIKGAEQLNRVKARVFVFGVGYDVNTRLLDRLARDGRGVREYVKPEESIEVKVSHLYTKIASPVLTDVSLEFDGIEAFDIYPQTPPDIFRGSQVVLLGRHSGSGDHALRLRGKVGAETREYTYRLAWGERRGASFMPTLWAMRKVGFLLESIRLHGERKELVDEVKRLGLKHGIVTPYTSLLVVEEGQGTGRPVTAARRREMERLVEEVEEATRDSYVAGPATGRGAQERSVATQSLTAPAAPSLDALDTEDEAGAAGFFGGEAKRAAKSVLGKAGAQGWPGRVKAKDLRQMQVRRLAGKTFLRKNGCWTDSAYQPDSALPVKTVPTLGEDYFALVREAPELAVYLSLGENVIVLWRGTVYKITGGGQRP